MFYRLKEFGNTLPRWWAPPQLPETHCTVCVHKIIVEFVEIIRFFLCFCFTCGLYLVYKVSPKSGKMQVESRESLKTEKVKTTKESRRYEFGLCFLCFLAFILEYPSSTCFKNISFPMQTSFHWHGKVFINFKHVDLIAKLHTCASTWLTRFTLS